MPARDVTFASLGVPAPLVAVLDGDGITTPFPIQAATLPDALAGRDILGRAKTGSGKTLGFSLPMVARLTDGHTAPGRPRGLVLVPTRELATQVQLVLMPLAHAMGLRVATIYGGVAYRPQVNALQRRTDILVACPGRLADLIEQGHCDLGEVEITVIDEADQMADLGFLPIVRRLLETTPSDGQRMLFSATLDSAVDVVARRFLTDPAQHSVDEHSSPAEIEHHVITIHPAHRLEVIAALAGGDKRSLVFTRTKHGAERLARQLTDAGIPAAELHGNLAQGARARNLAAFGTGAVSVMVATDIAARGIHVDGVDLVIHADPPAEHKAYVHRSGRTARGGADGVVVTMQTKAQARDVGKMMREAGVTPHLADAEPDSDVLREIGGPPAPRVTLNVKVTELVKPEERLTARPGDRAAGAGRPGRPKSRAERRAAGTPRSDRPRSDRPRSERPRAERPGRPDADRPAVAEERPAVTEVTEERPARAVRSDRPERFDRGQRFEGGKRSDRQERYDRPERSDRGRYGQSERPARFEKPAGPDRQGREPRDRFGKPDRFAQRDRDGSRERFAGPDRGDGRDRGDQQRRFSDRNDQRDRFGTHDRFHGRAGNDQRDRYDSRDRFDGRAGNDQRDRFDSRDRNDRPGRYDSRDRFDGRAGNDQRDRFDSRDRNDRRDQFGGGERRPARGERSWSDRPVARSGRPERAAGADRQRGEWAPASRSRNDRAAGSRPAQGAGRTPSRGGSWGGTTARSGYFGSRSTPGKRGNPGQGRHF